MIITEKEVAGIFQEKLDALKAELFLMLQRVHLEKVDVVLLAGQSSLFPLVGQTFQELAGVVDHVRDESGELVLKECVSRGALLLGGYYDWPIEGLKRLWTRLGRLAPGSGGTLLSFKELIPWGFPYPGESEPFPLARREMRGRQAFLDVYENLTLSDQPRSEFFRRYEWDLLEEKDGKQYLCKLSVDEHAQIEAFCEIGGTWEKGRVVGGG